MSLAWAQAARVRARASYVHTAAVPVISVGNLQVGGTGKTPMVLWLLGHLRDHCGRRPAMISRGYGRATRATQQVPTGGEARDYGDEPVLIARSGHLVVVGHRAQAARIAVENLGADVVVLDDGLQQRDLAVDLHLVLWDGTRVGSDACLPYGCLRAPLDILRPEHLLVLRRDVGDAQASRPCDGSAYIEAGYSDLRFTDSHGRADRPQGILLVAAGVGNPERLVQNMRRAGLQPTSSVMLADHCQWQAADVARVAAAVRQSGAQAVVITAKDAVKRRDWDTLFSVPVYVAHADFAPCNAGDHQRLEQHLERLWPIG